jgi:transcriptional regulator with XRE-family HTH domain
MDPTYLSKVERGENPPPSADILEAVANALQIDGDELLGLAGKTPTRVQRALEASPVPFAQMFDCLVRVDTLRGLKDLKAFVDAYEQLKRSNVPDTRRLLRMSEKLCSPDNMHSLGKLSELAERLHKELAVVVTKDQ